MAGERLRADAQANRDRILDVARKALADDPAASLNSIAKAARVGVGTLYRHFSSRESLLLGMYRQEIDALLARAPEMLARHPPLFAFHTWCFLLTGFWRLHYGAAEIFLMAASSPDLQETNKQVVDTIRRFMDACEKSGDIYPGADAADFLVLLALICRIPTSEIGRMQRQRLLKLAYRAIGAKHVLPH